MGILTFVADFGGIEMGVCFADARLAAGTLACLPFVGAFGGAVGFTAGFPAVLRGAVLADTAFSGPAFDPRLGAARFGADGLGLFGTAAGISEFLHMFRPRIWPQKTPLTLLTAW